MTGRPLSVRFALAMLLCAHQHHRQVSSFVPASLPQSSRCGHRPIVSNLPTPTSLRATALPSTSFTPKTKQSTQETSNELLSILQRKAASTSKPSAELDSQINSLVRTLIASKSSFDPVKCIDGPLYASVHFIGDTPLWEKIAGASGVRNVKGQKYTLDGGASGTFVNYAEVLGTSFYLTAVGDCNDEGPVLESSGAVEKSNNPLDALASLFGGDGRRQSSALLTTPYDYSASVTGASFVLFNKYSLDLSIEGTGTVRVLYADENLRVFLSPTDTNVTRGGGDWESKGLIVVQVRVDIVFDDWVDRL